MKGKHIVNKQQMTIDQLRRLAALGAQARIKELEAEIKMIRREFGLEEGSEAPATALKKEVGGVVNKRRLSPQARERIASAARKRWVAYRKAKAAAKKK